MFTMSQIKFITIEKSIFLIFKQQDDKLKLKLQVVSLRHIGRLSDKAKNVDLIFWKYLTKFFAK